MTEPIIVNLKFTPYGDGSHLTVDMVSPVDITRADWERLEEPSEMEVIIPEMAAEPTEEKKGAK